MHILNKNMANYNWQHFIIVLLSILLSKSLYYESFGTNILLIPFLIFLLIVNYKKRVFLKPILVLYISFFILIIFINQESNIRSILVLGLLFTISLYIINLINFREFTAYFSDIILILAIISWITFPVIYFDIPTLFFDFIAINMHHFRNFIFFGVSDGLISYSSFRNAGLWWEPGAFQVFINLSFIFNLIFNRMNNKKYFILLISIFLIQSTTGVIVFLLLSLLYFKDKLFASKYKSLLLLILFLFSLGAIFLLIPIITNKFDSEGNSFYSFLSRYYDVQISFNLFIDNFVLGYGYGSQIKNAVPYGADLIGYDVYYSLAQPTGSDGVSMLISQVGISGFLLIIPLLFPRYLAQKKLLEKIIISVSIFILLNTENFMFLLLFALLIFYGIDGNRKISLKEKRKKVAIRKIN